MVSTVFVMSEILFVDPLKADFFKKIFFSEDRENVHFNWWSRKLHQVSDSAFKNLIEFKNTSRDGKIQI